MANNLINHKLEKKVLCSILLEYSDITDILKSEDFYNSHYEHIYNILNKIRNNDIAVIIEACRKDGVINCETLLSDIMTQDAQPASCKTLARELREFGIRRRRVARLDSERKKTEDITVPIMDLEDVTTEEVSHNVAPEITRPGDHSEEFIESLTATSMMGVPIEIKKFNELVGGIRTDEVTIVIGDTGSGKSTFALNYAYWATEAGMKALVLPFERKMTLAIRKTLEIVTEKQLFQYSSYDNKYYLSEKPEWIKHQIIKMNDNNIWFFDKRKKSHKGYYSVDRLGSVIKYSAETLGINFFVVDHLDYIIPHAPKRNRSELIGETIRYLHTWATDYDAHIVVVAHPSNEGAKTLDLQSGKGSGSISQECENFFAIFANKKQLMTKVVTRKNTNTGNVGEMFFNVHENRNKFYEYEGIPKE